MANINEKICIIGAGPAGLSAAMYLEQKGYSNYTILEKEDHVGGKCHSPHYNGRRYEMGAIMGSGGMVVLSESSCMVDVARYFTAFTCAAAPSAELPPMECPTR